MAHDHSHHHEDVKNIKVAFFLNLSFTIIEFVGGILTNSVAILSDAVHDLGDSFSLGIQHSTIEFETFGENCEMEDCC